MAEAHPLDPLRSGELERSVALVRRHAGGAQDWRFAFVELREPDKQALHGLANGARPPREADAVVWNPADGQVFEAVVSLTDDRVVSWVNRPGVQPRITLDEFHEADHAVRAHAGFRTAMHARGFSDADIDERCLVDSWPYGPYIPERWRDRRIVWCNVWMRPAPRANLYGGMVDNLFPVVDLNRMDVLDVGDLGVLPRPPIRGEYLPDVTGTQLRDDIRPLEIRQPEGPSFGLEGWQLRWQNWELRVGFNHREGLTLHQVGYRDGGRVRPVAHRMSFAEMVVPYMDPSPGHYRRIAFDIGEFGLGELTNSLELGCDCLGEIRYLDATLVDSRGRPFTIRNAVCVHEEDAGLLAKHVDHELGSDTRRSRRLVVSFVATVANYEYLVYWRFYQDGSIECEVRASGIMIVSWLREGEAAPAWGTVVDERAYAPYHQHFLIARLDLDVDGEANTVFESHSEALPVSPENPYGLAMRTVKTPLRHELEARRTIDPATQRGWLVASSNAVNHLGQPTAYKLMPGANPLPFVAAGGGVLKRAQAITRHLWVTPYRPDERWPCGPYPNQRTEDDGLPLWTAADRPIEGTDVVLWYNFGIHHVTRVEDWPLMPVDITSFWLKPFGFFDRSPILDVPPVHHG